MRSCALLYRSTVITTRDTTTCPCICHTETPGKTSDKQQEEGSRRMYSGFYRSCDTIVPGYVFPPTTVHRTKNKEQLTFEYGQPSPEQQICTTATAVLRLHYLRLPSTRRRPLCVGDT
ncbi:unnamed protein product [Ectocarpus fasciculatus]